jgi:hypothetical protein
MSIDRTERVLDALAQQGAPTAVLDAVRALREDEGRIDAGGYLPMRAMELKRECRARTVAAIVEQLRALEADAAKASAIDLELHDRAEHERVTKADGHGAIDLDRVRIATSPAELAVLMRDALAHSPDGARRAWHFIEPRLREMAAREQRTHVIGTGATAFNLLCRLQVEMRQLSQRSPDRTAVAEAGQQRARQIRRHVLEVARVVGLDAEVERAARLVAVPERPEPGVVSGGWFDRFNTRK